MVDLEHEWADALGADRFSELKAGLVDLVAIVAPDAEVRAPE
jgi:hypothetical protein